MQSINKFLRWYFNKSTLPYWFLLFSDCMMVFLSSIIVFWCVERTQVLFSQRFDVLYTGLFYALLSIIGAKAFRTYSGVLRYSSFIDLLHIAYANVLNLVIAIMVSELLQYNDISAIAALSTTETVGTFVLASLLMWSIRIVVKTLFEVTISDNRTQRVLVYGRVTDAVSVGKTISSQRPARFKLCGFVSNDKQTNHILLFGKRVYNTEEDNLADVIHHKQISAVLVASQSENEFRNNQALQDLLIQNGCRIFIVQALKEANVKGGQISDDDEKGVMQIHEVQVEDLLPRDTISVDMESVGQLLSDTCVLITGSAGSIGSEMVKQIADFKPRKLILIDQAETPQHDIQLMMKKKFPNVATEVIVTSISRASRMESIFSHYRPDYVFHAAAYKHVPMMEYNPSEAVMNNVYGTKILADLSVKYGTKKFVMVSTDKAVNPTNVMGCSKRICEIYCQSLNTAIVAGKVKGVTQFVTTRFGNVLGSNGSVIPLFRKQIKEGGPVTVTDANIVRYFMLIPEACKLVLEAGTKGNGGEIFVFDMGEPVRIADLAKRMIALSNAKNVEIVYTGLRDGEKLFEEVLSDKESTKPTFHEKIRIAQVRQYDYSSVERDINELVEISKKYDNLATVKKMKAIVPEYKSNHSVYEKLD